MLNRKTGISPEGVERIQWYAEMQQQLFANPPEPEISDEEDEDEDDENEEFLLETNSNSRGSSHQGSHQSRNQNDSSQSRAGVSSSASKTASSRPKSKLTDASPPQSTFQNFAAMLAVESVDSVAASKDKFSYNPSTASSSAAAGASGSKMSTDKPLKQFPSEILEKSLIHLNSPTTIRSTLLCLSGFNDNGLCLLKYGDYLAKYDIEMVSIIFPGRLDRIDEPWFQSVSEFVEFVICCLLHHKYLRVVDSSTLFLSSSASATGSMISTFRSNDSLSFDQLILDDQQHSLHPSLALFGHNLGGIIAFEVAREIEKATRVTLPSPPLQVLIVSGCRPPPALTMFNKDEKSRKYSRDSNKVLLDRMIELGCVPSYLLSRRDMLFPYLSRFRSEYLALETYRYLRPLGASQSTPPLKCDIVAMCGGSDKTVSERLLMQWSEMTSGSFQHHLFDHGGHYYWLHIIRDEVTEKEGSGGGNSVSSFPTSHETSFLTTLIRSSNPFHILLSEADDDQKDQTSHHNHHNGDNHNGDNGDDEDDQKSAVSSVTFQDSYRANSPSADEKRSDGKISRGPSSRGLSRGNGSSRGGGGGGGGGSTGGGGFI